MPIDFSAIRRGTLAGRALRAPLRLIPRRTVLRILQGPARGARWVVGSGTHGCWLGSYERAKAGAFAASLRPGMCAYDIGANAGYYTIMAALRVGRAGLVAAFEPSPENAGFLRRHVQLNRLETVQVMEAAVSDRDGTATFDPGPDRSSGRLAAGGSVVVRTVALDRLLADGALPPPDVIKIDVEGAELSVLRGAGRLLREARPTIFLATHGSDRHVGCCALLRELGYRLEALDDRSVERTDEILARPAASARTPGG